MAETISHSSFQECFALAESLKNEKDPTRQKIDDILRAHFPGFTKTRWGAAELNDREGCDFVLERLNGFSLQFELKLRRKDYKEANGFDDLAMETWSMIDPETGRGIKIGWTRDTSKATDFVLWLWLDTGRYCLFPFPPICAIFQEHWRDWRKMYTQHTQWTDKKYQSEWLAVPWSKIWGEYQKWTSGCPSGEV